MQIFVIIKALKLYDEVFLVLKTNPRDNLFRFAFIKVESKYELVHCGNLLKFVQFPNCIYPYKYIVLNHLSWIVTPLQIMR